MSPFELYSPSFQVRWYKNMKGYDIKPKTIKPAVDKKHQADQILWFYIIFYLYYYPK